MVLLIREAIADEVYGEELQNGFGMMTIFSVFALTQIEQPSFYELLILALCSTIYVKFPSLRKICDKERKTTEGDSDVQ